jgi:hypothetical protein
MAPTRSSRYDCRCAGSTQKWGRACRPSHKCDFELRGGVVKAAAHRVERSESLDDAEHSSILVV